MRHEKYIVQRGKYLQVKIRYRDEYQQEKYFNKNISIDDFDTPTEAMEYACLIRDEALRKIRNNTMKSHVPTVEECYYKKFDLFPVSLRTRKKHDIFYRSGIDQYALISILKVSTATIQEDVNKYLSTHSDQATRHYIGVWSQIFRTAQMMGVDVPDRTKLIKRSRSKIVHQDRQVTISNEDFQKFLQALDNYGYDEHSKYLNRIMKYMLLIEYYTGMRPAEILALNADDITETGIRVNKAVGSTTTEKLTIIPPKTSSSYRTVPIHDDLRPILNALLLERTTSPLLVNDDGSLLNIDMISSRIRVISKKCGIPFNAYMLRHGFATDLIKQGIDARTTQDLLGHTTFSLSVEYARSSDDDRSVAVNSRKLN